MLLLQPKLVGASARARSRHAKAKRKPPPWTFSCKMSEGLHPEIFGVKDLERGRLAMSSWSIDDGVEIDLTLGAEAQVTGY